MGAWLSSLWSSAPPEPEGFDTPHPATGLTPRENKYVTDTWNLIKPNLKAVGIDLFIRYFEKFPHYQSNFKSFKNVPLDELPNNKKLQAHASNVIYALTAIVDTIDDPETLIEMLTKSGENHARRKIPKQAYLDLKIVLIDLLRQKLGKKLNADAVKAWEHTLDVAFSVILKQIEGGASD